MESTLLHPFSKAKNLKHWLAKPNCPAVIQECKTLFDKIYAQKVSEVDIVKGGVDADVGGVAKNIPADLYVLFGSLEHRAVMCTRICYNGVIYATSQTHIGNSWVQYYSHGNRFSLVAGSIKYIYQEQGKFILAIQRQLPVNGSASNAYAIYPHFPAKFHSYQLSPELEQVQTEWIYSH
jgi:hypothetical protein